MTMKRRIVYMEDKTWESIKQMADGQGITMSEAIRRAIIIQQRIEDGPTEQAMVNATIISPQVPAGWDWKEPEKTEVQPVKTSVTKPIVSVVSEKPFHQFRPAPKGGAAKRRTK